MQIIGVVEILYQNNYSVFADLFTDIFAGIITTGPALFSASKYLFSDILESWLLTYVTRYLSKKYVYLYNRM